MVHAKLLILAEGPRMVNVHMISTVLDLSGEPVTGTPSISISLISNFIIYG